MTIRNELIQRHSNTLWIRFYIAPFTTSGDMEALTVAPLDIHSEDSSKQKKNKNKILKMLFGIGVLVAVPAIGSTLAANITIGTNSTVQFGQGTATAAACDSSITVVPNASFNDTGSSFKLGSVTISNLDTVSCNGKTLRFRFYDSVGNATPLTVSSGGNNGTDAIVVTITDGTTGSLSEDGSYSISNPTTGTTGGFTITLASNDQPNTTSIARITVESY